LKLAILGGSFNPIHLGHLYLADTVLSSLDFDRVLFVPAHTSPFKQAAAAVSARDRLDMVLASIPGSPRLGVDDLEVRREGISYTIDTLNEIIGRYRPGGKPGLILGDDLAADFAKWRKAGEIAEKAEIIIARRISSGAEDFPFPHTRIQNDIMDISSGMVRERIARGAAWRSLVPQGARLIIEEKGLYGKKTPSVISPSLIVRVEDAVRSMLKTSRFIHSRGTALMTRDLALARGLDGEAAYLAGISHDMGKGLRDGELFALAGQDGKPVSALEREKPGLLHGRAAAVLLRERFGIHNREVLEAVALHTSGGVGMGVLAQILYIADKIEFSREGIDGTLRERFVKVLNGEESLSGLFRAVAEDNVRYLRSGNRAVMEETLEMLKQESGG
jgi:nicotinate-nucleotide adenylyltransferase